jgi:selenocysteine-specific elongation factor
VFVIATAGHVDHGKSTLIRALTGMEPDRWVEERRRGMTIDLGYAWTSLPDGGYVAFVDVPGHQRFITNMLAGIGPVPATLLVVAADEGWCRQTTEHVAALDALGVNHGVLAITKSDLGDGELAVEEAQGYLAGTSLESIEPVIVSPVTGTGLADLRLAIQRMTMTLPPPDPEFTRLWIDRVFTVRGAGTIVTGTLSCGGITVGDELLIAPSGEVVHVRGIETLKLPVESASAVSRVALSLRRTKRSELHRGDALVRPGEWTDAIEVDVRLDKASGRISTHPVVHIGSAAITSHLRPLDREIVRIRLDRSLPLHVGERAILREPGQQQVVAGVEVLDVLPPPLTRRGAARSRAQELRAIGAKPDLGSELTRRRVVRRSTLRAAGVLVPEPPPENLLIIGDWLVELGQWARWQQELATAIESWASDHPLQPGMPTAAAARRLQVPDQTILEALVNASADIISDRDGIHRACIHAILPDEVRSALDALILRLDASPFNAPDASELGAAGLTENYLAVAVNRGELVKLAEGVYLTPECLSRAAAVLASLQQPFTLSEARQALTTTRRVAMPLLELLDRQHVTRRVDSQRREMRSVPLP